MYRFFVTFMTFITMVTSLSGCYSDESFPGDPEVSSIRLEIQGQSDIPVGLNAKVKAIAEYSDGSKKNISPDVNWVLDNERFMTNGLTDTNEQRFKADVVSPSSSLLTNIKAELNGLESSNAVALSVSSAIIVELDVTPKEATVPAGLSQQFYANAVLSDARVLDVTDEEAVTWEINNGNIDKGLATSSAKGEILMVSASGDSKLQSFEASAELIVSTSDVASIEVQPVDGQIWNTELAESEYRELKGIITLTNGVVINPADNNDIIWSTTNNLTVDIDIQNGRVFAVGKNGGSAASITAKVREVSDSITFNVYEQPDSVAKIVATETELKTGSGMSFDFISQGSDGSLVDLTAGAQWSVDNNTYVHMVDNRLYAIPPGGYDPNLNYFDEIIVTVTASHGDLSDQYQVAIKDAEITAMIMTPNADTELALNNNLQMKAFIVYEDGSQEDVSQSPAMFWFTDAKTAFFSPIEEEKGLLITGEPETFTVEGNFYGYVSSKSTIRVTVLNKEVVSLQLTPESGFIAGIPQKLSATLGYSDGSIENVAIDGDTVSVTLDTSSWTGAGDIVLINGDTLYAKTEGQNGKLTAKYLKGSATSTCNMADLLCHQINVNVDAPLLTSSMQVAPSSVNLITYQSQELTVYHVDASGDKIEVPSSQLTYILDDPDNIVNHSEILKGNVVATNSSGNAVLTILDNTVPLSQTVDGKTPTATVNISVIDKELSSLDVLLPDEVSLLPGGRLTLNAMATYSDGSTSAVDNSDVSWLLDFKPANSAVMDGNELVALASGSGYIAAQYKAKPSVTSERKFVEITNATITALFITPEITELPYKLSQRFEAIAVADTGQSMRLGVGDVVWSVTKSPSGTVTEVNDDGSYSVHAGSNSGAVSISAQISGGLNAYIDDGVGLITTEFDVVPAEVISLTISSPLSGSDVYTSIEYPLQANVTTENGSVHDATDFVDWSVDGTDATINESLDGKVIVFNDKSVAKSIKITATPKDDRFGDYSDKSESFVNFIPKTTNSLVVTPSYANVEAHDSHQYRAYAIYSNGTNQEVTNIANWSLVDLGDGYLRISSPIKGVAKGENYGGTVGVRASYSGTTSNAAEFEVTQRTCSDGSNNWPDCPSTGDK
ncbi:hypothetical protein AB4428_18000 [Vibrio lentus]